MSYKAPTPGRFDARQNTTDYVHPQETNLLSLERAMQYRTDGSPEIRVNSTFEGNVVISGNVNIPGEVTVNSSPDNPVHVHLTELGTFGNLTTFVPIQGSVTIDGNANVVVVGNIAGITTLPAITGNVGVSGNVSITQMPAITGNVAIYDAGNSITIDGNVSITAMPPITGNVNIVSTPAVTIISDYYMNIARGLVDGQYLETKNGYASGINQTTEVTIWNEVVQYPWASWTTAQKLYITSDSASDVGQVLFIDGLDGSWNKITETVTTNGLTAVATTKNFYRINHCYIVSGNSNVGTIREHLVSGTGTVVGSMAPGFARNKGGFFTIPAGYNAYIMFGEATQFRGGAGNIGGVVKMYTRTGTGPFINQFMSEVVNGHYRTDFTVPLVMPATTDIDVRFIADGNGTQATCAWQMIMIPIP